MENYTVPAFAFATKEITETLARTVGPGAVHRDSRMQAYREDRYFLVFDVDVGFLMAGLGGLSETGGKRKWSSAFYLYISGVSRRISTSPGIRFSARLMSSKEECCIFSWVFW